tara:strand:+ start:176 stop:559 length:384 start_codon:yes stop_codon:yes gene_type:complete
MIGPKHVPREDFVEFVPMHKWDPPTTQPTPHAESEDHDQAPAATITADNAILSGVEMHTRMTPREEAMMKAPPLLKESPVQGNQLEAPSEFAQPSVQPEPGMGLSRNILPSILPPEMKSQSLIPIAP